MTVSDATKIEYFLRNLFSNTVYSQTVVDLTGDSEDDNTPTKRLSRVNATSRGTSRLGFSAEEPINLDPDDTEPPNAAASVKSQAEMSSLRSRPAEQEAHTSSQARTTESHSLNVQDDTASNPSRLPTFSESSANPSGSASQSTPQASPEKNPTSSRKRKRFLVPSSDDNRPENVNDDPIFEPVITSSIEPREPLPSQTFRRPQIQNSGHKQGSEDTSGTCDLVFGSTPIFDASDSDTIAYKYVTDTLKKHIQDLRTTHQYFTKVSLAQILSKEIRADIARHT